jgi:adenine-specific DNA-methyltransferase
MPPVRRQISPYAHALRQAATDVEIRMWFALRDRRLEGWKFKRPATVGRYVVDVLRVEARLIVELDGGQHAPEWDPPRTAFLESRGHRVLRFRNHDEIENLDGVLASIRGALDEVRPSPNPLPQVGEG